jgi:hypothetical protein
MANPAESIIAFFASIPTEQRELLLLRCAVQLDDRINYFKEMSEANSWLNAFLESADDERALRHFAKVLCFVAILDFELSPYALGRLVAMHERLIERDFKSPDSDGRIAEMSRRTLRDTVPQLKKIVDDWRDVRDHELDEATLWVYRDEMEQRHREATVKMIDRLRS